MPAFAEENLVMWRGYAHVVPLMDLLRLRAAGWVIEASDSPEVHLGVVHAVQAYDTPRDAARHLDLQAAVARQQREAARPRRRRGEEWVHADPPRADDARTQRAKTVRAERASRRSRRRSA